MKTKKAAHKHSFTPIAPEGGDEGGEVWKWCFRCGALRLGSEIFIPGTHQKKTIVSEK